jgi:DNA-binding PadR family transcriptional regulator
VRQTGKPDKKVYRITKAGRERLKRWVAELTALPRPKLDGLVKMVAAAMVNPASLARPGWPPETRDNRGRKDRPADGARVQGAAL